MITSISLLSVCAMSCFLIFNEDYDDGIIGRMALSTLSFSSGLGFAQHVLGRVHFDPVSQLFFASVAVFEARHIYRMYKGKTKSDSLVQLIQHVLCK